MLPTSRRRWRKDRGTTAPPRSKKTKKMKKKMFKKKKLNKKKEAEKKARQKKTKCTPALFPLYLGGCRPTAYNAAFQIEVAVMRMCSRAV